MADRTLLRSFLVRSASSAATTPVHTHSMLLALEPRMVFDASIPTVAEAVEAHETVAQAEAAAPAQQADGQDPQAGSFGPQAAQDFQILDVPLSDVWSEKPVITFSAAPNAFTVDEGETLNLGGGKLALADDSDLFTITVTVEHGTLSMDWVAGLDNNRYDFSNGDKTVSFTADKATCQNALNTLKYTADPGYNGSDELHVFVNDGYNVGDSGKGEEFIQAVTVSPVPDPPAFTGLPNDSALQPINEDTTGDVRFNYGTPDSPLWRPLVMTDPDSTDTGFNDTYSLTLSIEHGALSSSYGTGLGAASVSGDTRTYTLNNLSLDQVNGILAGLKFLGDQDYYGPAGLDVAVIDNKYNLYKGYAADRPSLVGQFTLDVLPVNDAPTLNPAERTDTAHQLTVKETGAGKEAFFDLSQFNTDFDISKYPLGIQPDQFVPEFDVDNNLQQLMIKITAAPTQGDIYRKMGSTWIKLGAGSAFSLWDVYQGNVKYVHNESLQVREELIPGSGQDHFAYQVDDGAGGIAQGTMYVALEPVNQAPSVAVAAGGVIDPGRLDSAWGTDADGNSILLYTIWAYEGEQGVPFSFTVNDPDQAPEADFVITFSQLPSPSLGYFWYDAGDGLGYQKVTAGMELSLARVQAGNLRFCHSGIENGGPVNFKITVTDDGGGEGAAGKKTITADMTINIRDNNDHPYWDRNHLASDVYADWTGPDHTHTVTLPVGSRTQVLTNSFLRVGDNESSAQGLTYTVTGISGDSGYLLYDTGAVDGLGQPIYRVINNGDKITQAEIDSGKVIWMFHGSGDKTADIRFTVRDGGMSAWPVPTDPEQPLGYPFTGTSIEGWEHGTGAHESGIGAWVLQGDGTYKWVLTTHTLHLVAKDIPTGTVPTPSPNRVDPVPQFDGTTQRIVMEGNTFTLDGTMLHAWFYNNGDASHTNITGQAGYPSATTENLVYRVEREASNGLLLYKNDNGTYSVIGQYGSFTQKDVNENRIVYLHDGSEHFTANFVFSVSDGRTEVSNGSGGTTFTQTFQITPRNDAPRAEQGDDVLVKEHDLPAGQSADKTTPGGKVTLTLSNINISDPDTGNIGNTLDPGGFSTPNDLYIIITGLPQHGTLYYNNAAITDIPTAAELTGYMNGAGYADWSTDLSFSYIIISKADIAAGKLVYQHDGSENFTDNFSYLVSDNKGIVYSDATHEALAYNGSTLATIDRNQSSVCQHTQNVHIVVAPVNDRPERVDPNPPHITVNEGDSVTLTSTQVSYEDPDGSAAAIQFILDTLPQYGTLYLNGKALGVGGVFTQADIDAGRVTYTHDNSEHHSDGFTCHVSDSIFYSNSNSEVFHIDVNPMNKAPVLTAPGTLYVESVAGGIIINGITLNDPDYGGMAPGDAGFPGTGIGQTPDWDHFTVDVTFGTTTGVNLALLEVLFNGENAPDPAHIVTQTTTTLTIRLTGNYAYLRDALSRVTIKTMNDPATPGRAYDPNGDVTMHITVHDGISLDNGATWVQPNGVGGNVLTDAKDVRIFISPYNDPPTITNADTYRAMTVGEDAGFTLVTDSQGNVLKIADPDAFERGGNSITLKVTYGTLNVDPLNGPGISGRGSDTVTITGTLAQINAVLATLRYKPNADFNGNDTLKITYKDAANTGQKPDSVTKKEGTDTIGNDNNFYYDRDGGTPGLGVYGEFRLTVTPVNDAPTVAAPDMLYIKDDYTFDGISPDVLGNTARITVDDVDISKHAVYPSSSGYHYDDHLHVELSLSGGGLAGMGSIAITGTWAGVTITGGGSSITLDGTKEAINTALQYLTYTPPPLSDDASSTVKLRIDVSDPGSSTGTNGNPAVGDTVKHAIKDIELFVSKVDLRPEITVPTATANPGVWSVLEDASGVQPFGGITLADADSFDAQIFAMLTVSQGTLDISAISGFTLSGNPANQDGLRLSADGKTVYFVGSTTKINTALAQLKYTPGADWNGQVEVAFYANDLGYTGEISPTADPAAQTPVAHAPAVSSLGGAFSRVGNMSGLAASKTGILTVIAVNDAPVWDSANNVVFWTNTSSADLEDTAAASVTPKTVDALFSGRFNDSKDQQYNASTNLNGSSADSLAGIVITGNAANAVTQGAWQYSLDGGTSWIALPAVSATNALYLDTSAQLRFVPVGDFNGVPGALTVFLADSSAVDAAHNAANPALPTSGTAVDISAASAKGGTTRYSADSRTLTTHVYAVNDAPVVTGSGPVTLATVAEDATPAGATVTSLFSTRFDDSKDNMTGKAVSGGSSANTFAGVVITGNAATAAQGTWQYSINSGGTWTNIPADCSDTSGLFLNAAAMIRFLPAADWNGTPGDLTVRLADSSAVDSRNPALLALPGNATRVDVSGGKHGGTTRYSDATLDLHTSVTAVNDAPVVVNGITETLNSISEDVASTTAANPGKTVTAVFASHFDDSRDTVAGGSTANNFAGVLITGYTQNTAQGYWQYSMDGINWTNIPTTAAGQGFALQANWSVRFNPAQDYNGTPTSLTARLIDDSATVAGSNPAASYGSLYAVSVFGGVTRYSLGTVTLGITVTAVNDAPEIVSGKQNITQNHQEDHVTSTTVNDLFASCFTDAKDNQYNATTNPGGSQADTFTGVIITQNGATATQGVWEYNTGSGWTALPTNLSLTNGLYLAANTQLRFTPSPDYNGTLGTMQVRLVESGSSYTSGQGSIDVTGANSGGATHVSAGTVTLDGSVVLENDAPVALNPNTPIVMTAINEDVTSAANAGQSVFSLFNPRFDDSKDNKTAYGGSSPNSLTGIIVTSVGVDANKGVWEYYDGGQWRAVTANMFLGQATMIRFQPALDWNGDAPVLTARLVESSASPPATASGTVIGSYAFGGTTPISADALTLKITVNPVNDAPYWNADAFSPLTDSGNGNQNFLFFGRIDSDGEIPGDNTDILAKTVEQALLGRNNAGAFLDERDNVPGGSDADALQGVMITGITGNPSLGVWQYYNGTTWVTITGVSENNALFLAKDTQIRFVYDPTHIIHHDEMPHSFLNIALVDDSGASNYLNGNAALANGGSYNISGVNRGGTTAVSEKSIPLAVAVLPMNFYPEFAADPVNISAAERTPVPLCPAVEVKDDNLDAGNWAGASITIRRDGGADADDLFGALNGGSLGDLIQGNELTYNGIVYGTVAKNTDGVLTLTFNANAQTSDVNNILRALVYENASHTPPSSVDLLWLVDDGNYARGGLYPQGVNHGHDLSGTVSHVQNVTISALAGPPRGVDDALTVNLGVTASGGGNVLHNDTGYDTDALTVTDSNERLTLYGTLTINADGTWTYSVDWNNPAVRALQPGQKLYEYPIRYSLFDGTDYDFAYLRIVLEKPADTSVDTPASIVTVPADPSRILPEDAQTSIYGPPPQDLLVDKPVVREVEIEREKLSASTRGALAALQDHLDTLKDGMDRFGVMLTGSVESRTMFAGISQTISLSKGLFRHTNPGETLFYQVTLADGSPLPPWLSWNADSFMFAGVPEFVLKEPLVIKIIAKDRFNNSATAYFHLEIREPDARAPADADVDAQDTPAPDENAFLSPRGNVPPSAPPLPGLMAQLAATGRSALLFKARESIAHIL